MSFDFTYDDKGITLTVRQRAPSFLKRVLSRPLGASLDEFASKDRTLLFALADLRLVAEPHADSFVVNDGAIWMSHDVAADLDAQTASVLGLPPVIDLIFATDIEGVPGQQQFRLRHEWLRLGERQIVSRQGSILKTSEGLRRIPRWLLEAVKVAEDFKSGSNLQDHWEALAYFRRALEPGFHQNDDSVRAQTRMSDFLRKLHVQIADGFSIMPTGSEIDPEFEVFPFSRKSLEEENEDTTDHDVSVTMAELAGRPLKEFQKRVRNKGALSAYRVGPSRFLVIDRSAAPALRVMAGMHHAAPEDRVAFIKNPRQKITIAIEQDLRDRGLLGGLTEAQQEEMVERIAFPTFVETKEYSERVTGKIVFSGSSASFQDGSGTTWLPEVFGDAVVKLIRGLPVKELEIIEEKIQQAISDGLASIVYDGERITATSTTERAIRRQIQTLVEEQDSKRGDADKKDKPTTVPEIQGPIILEVKENLEQVNWRGKVAPREVLIPITLPQNVSTPLKIHQVECFQWLVNAWQSGLPGILNADEQGLGKTLQTISFLAWLKVQMAKQGSKPKGPILIVAPTSLLENWEQEVARHLTPGGLGHLIRLFGSGISARRRSGHHGVDTLDGEEHLDLAFLHEAIAAGDGHQYWLLTTYTTLTNYQHSLGMVPFAALVFDEIQAMKSPGSLRAIAGMAMNADFRIGLTGTPIENSTTDLWAILEQLAPGRLVPLTEFRKLFNTPDETQLQLLYDSVFTTSSGLPPMALRRLKQDVAKELPAKTRVLHPRLMPDAQAEAYERARDKLATGTKGAALKMLHHIRTVSVHPSIAAIEGADEFIALSGRLEACFDIIDDIHARQERVLVFIEHIQMQYRFIELLKMRYGMRHIDLINGLTPANKRQDIVNRFQRHIENDEGFDLLVLGPKAAGTGLTLTAATHVIHLSRWWNPAVEEQCNDRVHRIGQTKQVTIHVPMAIHHDFRENSFDCLLHSLMTRKRKLASAALWPMGDTDSDAEQLQKMLADGITNADSGDPVHSAIMRTFERDQSPLPEQHSDRGYKYS